MYLMSLPVHLGLSGCVDYGGGGDGVVKEELRGGDCMSREMTFWYIVYGVLAYSSMRNGLYYTVELNRCWIGRMEERDPFTPNDVII
jgi:hypothetical protein